MTQNEDGGWGQRESDPSDLLSTAQAIPVLAQHGIARYMQRALAYLLACQQPNGGFTSTPDQTGPRPLPYDFPVLADVQTLNALNAVLPPLTVQLPSPQSWLSRLTGVVETRQKDPQPLTVPGFYCPLPSAVHPAAAELDQRTVAWMDRFQLYASDTQRTRLARARFGLLAARMCPHGREDLVQIMADYLIWGFALDDEYFDEGPLHDRPGEVAEAVARMHRIAESPEVIIDERDRYGMALRDLRMRIDALAKPEDGERFLDAVRGFFLGEVRKVGFVARRQRPGLDDYTAARLYMGGPISYVTLMAPISGIHLPGAVLADRRLRALIEMTAFLITWGPDIFSHGKDRGRSPDGFSPVDAIRHDRALRHGDPGSEEAAIAEAAALWERVMLLFLRLRDQVTVRASDDLATYLTELGYLIRGILEWTHDTDRYRYQDGVGGPEIIQTSPWLDKPTQDPGQPVQIPTIAWWWRVAEQAGQVKAKS